ncbi:MAG: hypothetical protein ACJ76D_10545 [Solirubrobacterales bacterium]
MKKNAVTAAKIKKNAVVGPKIAAGAVDGSKVKDGSLTGADINLGSLGTVPSADKANSAGSAGNANTVGGQTVVKLFKTLTAGQSNVVVGTVAGFTIIASCESGNADVKVTAPTSTAWVLNAAGVASNETNVTTSSYSAGEAGEAGEIEVDGLSEGGGANATYGVSSIYGAKTDGTVFSGVIGYDYDTFAGNPAETCLVAGHLTVG